MSNESISKKDLAPKRLERLRRIFSQDHVARGDRPGRTWTRLIVIGGELRPLSQTMVAPLTRFVIRELHVDKTLLGTIGLSLEGGLPTTDPSEAYTKERVMEHNPRCGPARRQQQGPQDIFHSFGAA